MRLDAAPWPGLVVRPRQTGDEIVLPGRPRRTLKKLFIDRKIPRLGRERIPVLADADGVLAVAGFGPNTAHPRYGDAGFEFVGGSPLSHRSMSGDSSPTRGEPRTHVLK